MTFTKREASLYGPVASYVRRMGYRRQEPELNFFEYRIDLYGLSKKLGSTLAVELKLNNWRRALEQALIYQLCSDFVYIAVPLITALRVQRDLLCRHGIGLIAIAENGRCQVIVHSSQSSVVRGHYKKLFIQHLHRSQNGE
jgi:hypothetical protein